MYHIRFPFGDVVTLYSRGCRKLKNDSKFIGIYGANMYHRLRYCPREIVAMRAIPDDKIYHDDSLYAVQWAPGVKKHQFRVKGQCHILFPTLIELLNYVHNDL